VPLLPEDLVEVLEYLVEMGLEEVMQVVVVVDGERQVDLVVVDTQEEPAAKQSPSMVTQ
jgi:hypothetical protein